MKIQKLLSAALAVLLLLSLLSGCAAQDAATENFDMAPAEGAYDYNGIYSESKIEMAEPEAPGSGTADTLSERKLIKTFDLDTETEDLDALLDQLSGKIVELGGYVEQQELYNGSAYSSRRSRSVSMIVRIPADKVNNFITHVDERTNIVTQRSNVDDVTLTYVATESRVKALQTEEARLLELMEMAETMTDLLEIEARLTDVRYELESVTSQLNVLKNQVSYSTVNLYISEVIEYTPVEEETFWQRVTGGFRESLEDLGNAIVDITVFLLTKLPYIVVLGVITLVVIVIIRRARRTKLKTPPQDSDQA